MKNKMSQKLNFTRRNFIKTLGISSAGMIVKPTILSEVVTAKPQNSSIVATASISTYDEKQLTQAVEKSFENIGGLGDILKQGDRVGIKINLTGGAPQAHNYQDESGIHPGESYWTNPVLLKVVGQALRDAGAGKIYILEAVYDLESINDFGYKEVIEYLDAEFIDLNKKEPYEDYITKSVGDDYLIYPQFTFNGIFDELDCFISMPKAKQHATAGVTHGMKNLIGTLPLGSGIYNNGASHRAAIHQIRDYDGNKHSNLCRVIIDINKAIPINLVVNDAIKTVLGSEGPWTNDGVKPANFDNLIIGKDPVAVDSISTSIMEFDPMAEDENFPYKKSINYLKLASEKSLGEYDLSKIEIVDYVTDIERESSLLLPNSVQLNQNYPNPFNPSTTIQFSAHKTMNVTLTVYDMQGQEIAVLYNGTASAGLHELNWDAQNFASGIYYYTIIADKFRETKKMVLNK